MLNKITDIPSSTELLLLKSLVNTARLNYEDRNNLFREIEGCMDYIHFQRLESFLESIQVSIDEISNPTQSDILKHLKRFI